MIRVHVEAVGIEQISMNPVVILATTDGDMFLPLVIGPAEANSIGLILEGIETPRPMTHDLMVTLLETLETKLEKVVISDLRDDTYFATIYLRKGDERLEIDARPSDSIALALRTNAPIFVSDVVADQAMVRQEVEDPELEDFRRFLDNLTPEDFRQNRPD